MDSTVNPKVKITKRKRIGARVLVHSILGVKGHVGTLRWKLRKVTSKSITHMNLHKPSNKLVNA
jgi:hypothetical protein